MDELILMAQAGDEAYAGKVFEYNIKINGVYDIELTDEVVSSLSNGADTVSEYKKFIKNHLEYLSLNDIGENEVEELCNEAVVKSYPEDVLTYDVQQEFVKIMNLAGVNSMEDDAFEDYVKKQGYDHLEEYINNGFAPQEPYASRMKDFFLYRDDHCCDRLYDAMIND